MKKVFTLSTCDTSKRILKPLRLDSFDIKDIKNAKLTKDDLDLMHSLVGSYELLFSRRSRSYSAMGLKNKELKEEDYRSLILEDYTFLKRPVIIDGKNIFVGNQKKNIEQMYNHFDVKA